MTSLESLKKHTIVVADTGDIDAIAKHKPQDATTNPSLLLKVAQLPRYAPLVDEALAYARATATDSAGQAVAFRDKLAVNFGCEILKLVPGRVSKAAWPRRARSSSCTARRASSASGS